MAKAIIKTLSNGYTLRYTRFGQGETIVFLHGYPETHSVWLPLMAQLSNQYDVLAFDWPGMGGSQPWKGGSTPKSMGARVISILDLLQIDRAHLVGHDMGAQPALVCAADFPERIRSVTVINSLLIHDAETSWEIKYLRNLSLNTLILSYLPKIVFRRALSTFGKNENKLDPKLKAEFWRHFRQLAVRQYVIRMCYGYQAQLPNLARYYSTVSCPVLAIWSSDNKHFSIDHAHRLQQVLPHTSIKTINSSCHWLGYYRCIETKALLLNFYTSI